MQFMRHMQYAHLMELHEIETLTLKGAPGHTVPVPPDLDRDIAMHPEDYGLPPGTSARQARAMLLLAGARAAKVGQLQSAREAAYRKMTADPDWQQAREETRAEMAEDSRF